MLTSTSIRSPTVLVFCSKLQLSSPSLSCVPHHVKVFTTPGIIASLSPLFHFCPSEEELPTPSALEEKVRIFDGSSVSIFTHAEKDLSISPQQKQQELKRVEKWLKMVKNWDKYRNSEKVCVASPPPFDSPQCDVPFLFHLLLLFHYSSPTTFLINIMTPHMMTPHFLNPLLSRGRLS